MRLSKKRRQELIKTILSTAEVSSQHQLQNILLERGIVVRQPTLSRDLREMAVVKNIKGFGKFVYRVQTDSSSAGADEFRHKFMNIVKDIKSAENIILIKTTPGEAQGVAKVIDEADIQFILGTVGGDDTVLVVVEKKSEVEKVLDVFNKAKNGPLGRDHSL